MSLDVRLVAAKIKLIWQERPDRICCNIDLMAERLHMSCRTLQRRLREEDTCYLTLQDSARLNLTLSLFAESKSVKEVSEILGFSNRRSFTRAFKRWTGESPKTYKKQ